MDTADRQAMELILELGVATQAQIDDAIHVRAQMLEMGMQPRSVAEILFEKGHIEREAFEDVRRKERRFQGQEQIAGYRLLERLGEGAMGIVYKARQISLDRDVAIKVLAPDLGKDEAYIERFMTEARAVARLNHTNVISGIDVGDADGIKYMVMEYADGMTVASILRRGGAMDEERVLRIGQQMARALDHAHRNGLIHRDVKPDNIIITGDGVAKLCDLGLARIESDTDDGGRMGTPAYMSPELARHDRAVDERTDLYSLGATLFHMLTGREPYTGSNGAAVMAKHLTEPVPFAPDLDPSVTPETGALVAQLMAKQPAERISSAKELVELLDARIRSLQAARGAGASSSVAARPSAAAPAPERPAPAAAPTVRRQRRRRR